MKKLFMGVLAFAMLVSLSVSDAFAAKKVYRISMTGCFMDNSAVVKDVFKPWLKELETKSKGRFKCTYFSPNTICQLGEITDSVVSGRVTIALQNVNANPGRLPLSMLYGSATGGVVSGLGPTEGYWNLVAKHPEFFDEYEGMKVLAMYLDPGMTVSTVKGKPITEFASMKGLRLLAPGGVGVHMLNSLGAQASQVAPTEWYLAMQRNMADGFLSSPTYVRSLKLAEVTASSTFYGHPTILYYLAVNKDFYDSLPDDLKAILDEYTGVDFSMRLALANEKCVVNDMNALKEQGHTFYVVKERKPFIDCFLPTGLRNAKELVKAKKLDGEKYFELCRKYVSEGIAKHGNGTLVFD